VRWTRDSRPIIALVLAVYVAQLLLLTLDARLEAATLAPVHDVEDINLKLKVTATRRHFTEFLKSADHG
jgi:hypothetical protein